MGGPAKDIRVNQQQIDASGMRVGVNRPDLQFTVDALRPNDAKPRLRLGVSPLPIASARPVRRSTSSS